MFQTDLFLLANQLSNSGCIGEQIRQPYEIRQQTNLNRILNWRSVFYFKKIKMGKVFKILNQLN